jgi:Domain of unknown function (DUF4386)
LELQDLTGLVGSASTRLPSPPQVAASNATPFDVLVNQGDEWLDVSPVQRLDCNAQFVAGKTSTASLKLGAVLEFGLIVTQIGTAVVIYRLVKRQNETVSLGYVSARLMESVFAAIGLLSIISVVSVASAVHAATGVERTSLTTQGNSLVHTYDWAFQWGPGLVPGIGNGLLLGYLMYRSALVPPRMALLGLIGGPLLIISFVLILCGAYKNGSSASQLLALPEAAWELSLGVYCAWKGFRSESTLAGSQTVIAQQRQPVL